jgi:hypothetical protein
MKINNVIGLIVLYSAIAFCFGVYVDFNLILKRPYLFIIFVMFNVFSSLVGLILFISLCGFSFDDEQSPKKIINWSLYD